MRARFLLVCLTVILAVNWGSTKPVWADGPRATGQGEVTAVTSFADTGYITFPGPSGALLRFCSGRTDRLHVKAAIWPIPSARFGQDPVQPAVYYETEFDLDPGQCTIVRRDGWPGLVNDLYWPIARFWYSPGPSGIIGANVIRLGGTNAALAAPRVYPLESIPWWVNPMLPWQNPSQKRSVDPGQYLWRGR